VAGIFISYRRDDTAHAAARLVEHLKDFFSGDELFFDIDSIEPGLDFVSAISEKVQTCDVLLALIGPQWTDARDALGSRCIENPKDFVRIEIEAALARGIRVIPVLVDGARMPKEADLPESLRPITSRNAVRLVHERFKSEAEELTRTLMRIVQGAKRERSAPGSFRSATDGRSGFAGAGLAAAISAVVLAVNFFIGLLFSQMKWLWIGHDPFETGFLVAGLVTIPIVGAVLHSRWRHASGKEVAILVAAVALLSSWTVFVAGVAVTKGNPGFFSFALPLLVGVIITIVLWMKWRARLGSLNRAFDRQAA
jgi:hypothetical protein